jgi:tetratricopeptide (TPR) repeat protein
LSFPLRTALVCIVFLTVCCDVTATSVLLHSASKAAPELFPVQTYAGKSDVTVSAVHPSSSVTIVLLIDALSPAQLDNAKRDLLALYPSLHTHSLRLALLRSSSLGVAGPFASRSRLKSALDEAAQAATDPTRASPVAILDTLCAAAPQLGSDWSQVLLIGELSVLDHAVLDYASALLLRAFGGQRIQLSWAAPSGEMDAWLPVLKSTGGNIVRGSLHEFAVSLDERPQFSFQVDWTPVAPSVGFVVSHSALSDQQGQLLIETSDLAAPAAASLPSLDSYLAMQRKTAEAADLLSHEPFPPASVERVRDDLQAALEINPREPETLLTAAAFYENVRDYATAASLRASLVEVRPLDAAAHAALGRVLLQSSDLNKAEAALHRAVDIAGSTPQIAEDFARIHITRKDDKGALPYLEEALRADPNRQDLWFLEAQAAERLAQSSLAIQSFEHGLVLGGVHIPETASLLRLDLATKQESKAAEWARRVITTLPPDPAVRSEFAGILDDLQQSAEALEAWRRVLEVRPDFDRAHYRVAQLLLDSGDARAAEQAADAGIAASPKFAGFYIVKADALEKRGRMYDARGTLRIGAAMAPDPNLLLRLAVAEDTYGASAADAYARLAESLGTSSPERHHALERGFAVSVRDNDFKQAGSFAALLESAGHPEFRGLLGTDQRRDPGMMIPGGLEALAFVAHAEQRVPRERFFADYCRAVINQIGNQAQYVEGIREHFQRIAALEALGKHDGSRVVITLSLNGKDARRNTERVLNLLGIKLHSSNGDIAMNRGVKKDQAKKQETVSALALDEVGMQEAFQAGKPYTFDIPYESAPLYPNEKLWRETFYAKENDSGGFATAVLRMPKLAHLYLALNSLDRKSISELLSVIPLGTLYERHTDLLDNFAPAFALEGSRAAVPGGRSAEPIWAGLAGVSPDRPGAFFRALLERENGKLLAFFFTLSQLDKAHQSFFTANASRTAQFYKLFAATQEVQHRSSGGYSTFTEVLRSVPLDQLNHVNFPGSAEVWAVAKGHSTSELQGAKSPKKVPKAAAPDVEDEVLLRLAQTHYSNKTGRHTELDNFLAVSRIDAHRATPLDEESALLLAQRYSDSADGYAYFTDLKALEAADFRKFFTAVDRLRSAPPMDANFRLGQLHSIIEWICLFLREQIIGDGEAEKLFRYVCDRFAAADGGAAYTSASLDSARAILVYCKPQDNIFSLDQKIRFCLVGSSTPFAIRRITEFQRLLELQRVPSLDALFSVYDAVVKRPSMSSGDISTIEKATASFPSVTLQKGTKVDGREKENLLRYDPSSIHKVADELRQNAAKRKANPKDFEKLSHQLLAAIEPQVTVALAGPVYAFFLRPSDLVVSDDPLLLRKHRYLNFTAEASLRQTLSESRFQKESERAGSYFAGGFAQFALAAGTAAAVGWKTAGHGGTEAIAAEIAAIRATNWDQLKESDQRIVSLRIEAAREWIFESARRQEEFRTLSEETMGLLSLARRAELLGGVESRNWSQVWNAVTLPDLFAIGGRYLDRYNNDVWPSPVMGALRAVSNTNDGSRLSALGAVTYHSFGCNHPHLRPNAPYEEYERHMFPDEIAERFAEFKLFLVYRADSLGVEPPALAGVAEILAAKAFRVAQMTDYRDWRALLAAYSSISPNDLKQALEH